MPLGGGLTLAASLAGPLIGGIFGNKSASKASKQQQESAMLAIKQLQGDKDAAMSSISNAASIGQGYSTDAKNQQLDLYNPYVKAGTDSLSSLKELSGENGPLGEKFSFNPSDLAKDPGYAFTLKQGQDAINRSAAARGGLFNTGTLKSLAGYTEGTANTYFNDAYKRAAETFGINRQGAMDRIGALQNLAGFGMQGTNASSNAIQNSGQFNATLGVKAAEDTGDIGMRTSDKIADLITGRGNSQAASTLAQGDNWSKTLQSGTSSILQWLAGRKSGSGTGAVEFGQPGYQP